MKLAVISDIHGNLAALDAVLADIKNQEVDNTVNLGDICSGGLFPSETADRLIPLCLPTIKGNHERQLLAGKGLGLSDQYAANTLRPDQISWISNLPETLSIDHGILLVHGSPSSDTTYLLETVTKTGVRSATEKEVIERVGNANDKIILCGHTHLPRMIQLANEQLIVNPGSVGLPAYSDDSPYPHVMESGSPHARYAIISIESGLRKVEFRKVEYDWETAAIHAASHARHDLVIPLRTGRVREI
ncbi:metallophosphoesterase family protein [Carnimonas bestiolae]|uniref:metallophosphoesterase family protein n=1 Tax=Carnimonas bestiolae TaxID=3402172 RepID=UPI003EDC7BF1